MAPPGLPSGRLRRHRAGGSSARRAASRSVTHGSQGCNEEAAVYAHSLGGCVGQPLVPGAPSRISGAACLPRGSHQGADVHHGRHPGAPLGGESCRVVTACGGTTEFTPSARKRKRPHTAPSRLRRRLAVEDRAGRAPPAPRGDSERGRCARMAASRRAAAAAGVL